MRGYWKKNLLSSDAHQNVNRATIARVTKSWIIKMLYTLKKKESICSMYWPIKYIKALDQHIISDALTVLSSVSILGN